MMPSKTITPNFRKNSAASFSSKSSIWYDLVKPSSSSGNGSNGGAIWPSCSIQKQFFFKIDLQIEQSVIQHSDAKMASEFSIGFSMLDQIKSQLNQYIFQLMKGLKSKTVLPPPPLPSLPRLSSKHKRKPTDQAMQTREITMHCVQGKVIFSLKKINSILGRALVRAFSSEYFQFSDFSLLLELKAARPIRKEFIYRHTLDQMEAVGLYSHLMRKRRGEANELQQMGELIKILSGYKLSLNQLEGAQREQIEKFNEEVERIRLAIKTSRNQMKNQVQANFSNSEDAFKASLLQAKIRQLGVELIDLMVVAVKENVDDKVEVIFEQSYPEKTCSRQFLINVLGEQRYNAKKLNFVRFYRTARIHHRRNTNFIVCHFCKQPLIDSYLRCQNRPESQLIPTHKNSPNTYYRHLLAADYCYHPSNRLGKEDLQLELDYFKYFRPPEQGDYACHRFMCKGCTDKHVIIENVEVIFDYACPFCVETCFCRSCTIVQEIIMALALLKQILIQNCQPLDQYKQLIEFVNLDHPQDVVISQNTRSTFQGPSIKQYHSYYINALEQFTKIYNVMEKIELESMREDGLDDDLKVVITDYMIQVYNYIQSVKKQNSKKRKKINTQSLSIAKKENQRYLKQIKRWQEHQKLQGKEQPYNFKQQFIKCGKIAPKIHRYQVPFEAFDLIDGEWFFSEGELQKISQQLISKLTPIDQNDIKAVCIFRKEIPFEKIDYELAINVRKQCKIYQQIDLMLYQAMQKDIIYQQNHPIYGFRGGKMRRFYDRGQEFCDFLQDSEESDPDDEQIEGQSRISVQDQSVQSFVKQQTDGVKQLFEVTLKNPNQTQPNFEQDSMEEEKDDDIIYSPVGSSFVIGTLQSNQPYIILEPPQNLQPQAQASQNQPKTQPLENQQRPELQQSDSFSSHDRF